MNCLTIPNPWASCCVFGVHPFINMDHPPDRHQTILIASAPYPDDEAYKIKGFGYHNRMHHAYRKMHGMLLGTVDVEGVTDLEDCQIPGATGPILWQINTPMVAMAPIPIQIECDEFDINVRTIGLDEYDLMRRLDLTPPMRALSLIHEKTIEIKTPMAGDIQFVNPPSKQDPLYRGD